ncbi:MAG: SpoIIE family protein phosphatase [Oscillospiraceae bacterium]|nr:SpoIIE family protein phosphatase [Oscillospiraceae bacterium]
MEDVKVSRFKEKKKIKFVMSSTIKSIIKQVFYFFFGIIMARSVVFENLMPFSVAMTASVPYVTMVTFFFGQSFGLLLPISPSSSVAYISASIAVISMRWALNDLEYVKKSKLFASSVTLIPIACTLLVLRSSVEFNIKIVISVIFESALASISAYFFSNTIKVLSGRRKFKLLSNQEFLCCSITCLFFLIGLCAYHIFGISIGKIAFCLIILFFSFYFALPGALISGLSVGAVFSLSSTSNLIVSIACAFSGILSGFFVRFGRIFVCFIFSISYVMFHILTGDLILAFYSILESFLSTAIFMVIPPNLGEQFSRLLLESTQKATPSEMKKYVVSKIDFASKAIMNVAQCVCQVANKLYELDKKENEDTVFFNAIKKTCDRCNLNPLCHGKYNDETSQVFEVAKNVVDKANSFSKADFSETFQKRCCRVNKVAKTINVYKQEQVQKKSAKQRINEFKELISNRFFSEADILSELSNEFFCSEKTNATLSEEIHKTIESAGCKPNHVTCIYDNENRILIEIEMNSCFSSTFKKLILKNSFEKLCARNLDDPVLCTVGEKTRVNICEKPVLQAKVISSQHVCNNRNLCGDNFTYFKDGCGKMIIVLSDGMGTGGYAAVDSAMTSEIFSSLVKANISFDTALKITNFAMMLKSNDESIATLDVVVINLFTGQTEFLKAGSPFSLIRKAEKTKRICVESLPIGIFKKAKFEKEKIKLDTGSLIVVFSDGIITTSENWLEDELKLLKDEEVENFSQYLVDEARKRQEDNYDDDMTAIVVKLSKN